MDNMDNGPLTERMNPMTLVGMTPHKSRPTFAKLVAQEPRLRTLLQRAQAVKDDRRKPAFCANAVWYGYGPYHGRGLKEQLCWLVGWGRKDGHPILATEEAYDVAYETIYLALPNCRECLCG
jgi:hypothetical protein